MSRAPDRSLLPGLALAVFGAIAFSGKAIIVKLAYRYGVDAVTLIMYRMLFALPIFLVMAWWASRGKAPLTGRDWLGVIGLGITGYYLSSFLDFLGLQYITASLERLILYLNPTLVLLLGWLLYRKAFRPMQLAGMAISYCGVLLVFGHEVQAARRAGRAGHAAGVRQRRDLRHLPGVQRRVGAAPGLAAAGGAGDFGGLPVLPAAVRGVAPAGSALEVAPQVIWLSVLNATLCTAVPVLLVMMAIERIGPALSAQTGMVGPMSTILMGVLILGEPFTAWIAAGTVLVIAGIFVFSQAGR